MTLDRQLQQLGYTLDASHAIWCRPDYSGIAYNDGDEVETRIAAAIAGAQDLSVLSPELRQHYTDWPSLYHLTSARANLMRPFASYFNPNAKVLEIGAGCGAITRYMGECGAQVLALEGTPRRAAIARSRTRDLANVTVLSERFNDFAPPVEMQFDVVTLIGVLEYANLFTPSDNPHLSMLARVRQLLKPDGLLIIAIENQLGLKYFAGAPEDHIGQPMYGIEGRYQAKQPQTFGLKAIKALLHEAGFAQQQFMSPLPDYKLPSSIVTESGFANPDFDSAAFAWQTARQDPQLPPITNFSLELAWPEIEKNGLALDMANSFLIGAKLNATIQPIDKSILAYHYSANRLPQFCKQTHFVQQIDRIELHVSRLVAPHEGTVKGEILNQHLDSIQPYTLGEPLSKRFVSLVTEDGWSLVQLREYLRTWFGIVQTQVSKNGQHFDLANLTVNTLIPSACIDCVAQNIIMRDRQTPEFIDQEWTSAEPIKLGHLIFRQSLMLLNSVSCFAPCKDIHPMKRETFIQQVFQLLNLKVSTQDLAIYGLLEAQIQQTVGSTHLQQVDWQLQTSLNYHRVHHNNAKSLTQQDTEIAALKSQLIEQNKKLLELNSILINKDNELINTSILLDNKNTHINQIQAELHSIHQQNHHHWTQLQKALGQNHFHYTQLHQIQTSTAWRLTKPLRVLGNILPTGMRQTLRKVGKAAWWAVTPWKISARLRARDNNASAHELTAAMHHASSSKHDSTSHPQLTIEPIHVSQPSEVSLIPAKSIEQIFDEKFPELKSISSFPISGNVRINLITDTLSSGSLFGGVATSIIFATLLAERKQCDLRVITRTSRADRSNFNEILKIYDIEFTQKLTFDYSPIFDNEESIAVSENDIFITTSWWTSHAVKKSFKNKIIYLLQEDERMFYSFSDARLMCENILNDPNIFKIVNTALLHNYLKNSSNIDDHISMHFEPAFPKNLYHPANRIINSTKKRLFFYARPNNERNLYYLGLNLLNKAIANGTINTSEWDILFAGSNAIDNFEFVDGSKPTVMPRMNLSEYAAFCRSLDVGLVLMYTPHPSYPPLDLAQSGCTVVTNQYGTKQNLSIYSPNIITCELNVDALLTGLHKAISVTASKTSTEQEEFKNNIPINWVATFDKIFEKLDDIL